MWYSTTEDYSIHTSEKWSFRKNEKMLMETTRSMLSGVGLGHEFWVEEVDMECYLFNISPSLALEDKTPHELWTSKKPSPHIPWYLVVVHMYMFHGRKEPIWIVSLEVESLLGIRMV